MILFSTLKSSVFYYPTDYSTGFLIVGDFFRKYAYAVWYTVVISWKTDGFRKCKYSLFRTNFFRKDFSSMKAYERLLSYVKIFTPSNEESTSSPSSRCQFDLARLLVEELKGLGISDVTLDDHCYVYAHLPATEGLEHCKALGFIAHMDTVSDFCDHAVTPVITENYDGKDLPLGTSGRTLSPEMFSHLTSLAGRTLITSDGTTILGADDKAGIAEILTALEHILTEKIPHGPLCVAFTPDEEIGMGPAHFNVKKFGADYAYTLDGDTEGEIQYENFNACSAKVTFQGVNVHPGSSKNTMINAALVAMEFDSMLPSVDTPRNTADYQGFFHLCSMKGDVSRAELQYIVRDHDAASFEVRQKTLAHITEILNEKWGEGTVTLTITQQYRNMKEIIDTCPWLITLAEDACRACGVTPLILPIRGGTDGAQLSFMGLPCPNLGTGGHAYHGPYEHITVEGMDAAVDVTLEIIKLFSQRKG